MSVSDSCASVFPSPVATVSGRPSLSVSDASPYQRDGDMTIAVAGRYRFTAT
jgi:hypothetical protein